MKMTESITAASKMNGSNPLSSFSSPHANRKDEHNTLNEDSSNAVVSSRTPNSPQHLDKKIRGVNDHHVHNHHNGNGQHHHHQQQIQQQQQHHQLQIQQQDDIETPPSTATGSPIDSGSPTDFPSLPPFEKAEYDGGGAVVSSDDGGGGGGSDCNGNGGSNEYNGGISTLERNKRPTRDRVLRTLSDALMRRSLTMIDLSQRDLRPTDATLIKLALLQNSSLSVLKLGYNNLRNEGVATLASGISTHAALTSLDLGFNDIGDQGCIALASAILSTSTRGGCCKLHTLYLAGNSIGEEGARALAQVVRCGCGLKIIHLTGNSIGPDGVTELMDAVIDQERKVAGQLSNDSGNKSTSGAPIDQSFSSITTSIYGGLTELFLGGTNMGHTGCIAVAKMLEDTKSLRVLSLANCDLCDAEAILLANAITKNCKELPLEKLQLSFNNLTCKGIEALMNAVWGLKKLKDLQLDNNKMQTRGAQVVAAVLGAVKTLTRLNVGFNPMHGSGIKILMKSVAESKTLTSLTVSGINIDANSANAVAIALAHNTSLTSIYLDHCSIPNEGLRLTTAGIVSNSNTKLQVLTGFRLGSYAKILRLPEAMEQWSNEQVLSFILLMWKHMRPGKEDTNTIDPLTLLPAVNGEKISIPLSRTGPVDAATTVAVAKRAFEALGPQGEKLLSQKSARSRLHSFESPLAGDVIVVEANRVTSPIDHCDSSNDENNIRSRSHLHHAIPEELVVHTCNTTIGKAPLLDQSTRKKKIVKWLCNNMYHLNELSNLPFNAGELWRIHQHFVSPTIQETNLFSNGESSHATESSMNSFNLSVHACSSISSEPCAPSQSSEFSSAAASEPVMGGNPTMLKRKVSYRFLHEATTTIQNPVKPDLAVSKLIEDMNGHSMQPKFKRARRNRSRISIVPRIKQKLDSYLVSDHHRALGLMRQLAYVEKSLLNGSIYPVEDLGTTNHLFDSLASDAEMILVDMM